MLVSAFTSTLVARSLDAVAGVLGAGLGAGAGGGPAKQKMPRAQLLTLRRGGMAKWQMYAAANSRRDKQ